MQRGCMIIDYDGVVCGVASKAEEGTEPFISILLADPRGSSFSVRISGESAKRLAECLMEESTNIRDAEEAWETENQQADLAAIDRLNRGRRYE